MASRKSEAKTAEKPQTQSNGAAKTDNGSGAQSPPNMAPPTRNPHGIPDWRLEQIPFHIEGEWKDGEYHYKVVGDTTGDAPALRPSKYLDREKSIELYRLMLANRRMEETLERMYKQ